MSESNMRGHVIRALKPLHAVPVENPVNPGTPDVNCTAGWIELKWIREIPKKKDGVVKLPHFTKQQRMWLRKRSNAGGHCWLLLQYRRTWMLFDGFTAAEIVGKVSYDSLKGNAEIYWLNGLNKKELILWLQESQ